MTDSNNRHLERKNLVYFPEVINRETNAVIGRVIDLTIEGFLIVSDTPLESGSVIKIEVKWTDELDKQTSLVCEATVQWCKEDINPAYMAIGMHISNISNTDKESIKRLIRKWSFPTWK